ncbi:TlpA family protein disulfide reductase [Kordiimonas marina]|uniref:TlpA family protein disulfide reductase n=1 Tax=Kordiimonas marina TaxID=2872312 RepID=UPI001FF622AC|nr:TlpA disulfide reductase family protein [Kordiimonas marina]MCJ9428644.1 TlpA family protein disulfide reductase [Kordiimonas marina]
MKVLRRFFALALMLLSWPASLAYAASIPVPAVAATALDGRHVDSAAFRRRKPVYLYFFAQWCETYLMNTDKAAAGRCAEATKAMQALEASYGDRIAIIGIASSLSATPDGVRAFIKKHDVRYPVVFDEGGRLFSAFGVMAFPTSVLIGQDGTLSARLVGTAGVDRLEGLLSHSPALR